MRLAATDHGFIVLDGKVLAMPRKERLVLAMLIASWPEPIAKERFAARVWGDDMSDESLARCISGIRRLLPHDAGVDVRAVYGFGYRLVTRQQASLQLGAGGHQRLQEIAAGAAPWVETVLHVRGVIERRDVRAMAQARDLLRALVLEASGFAPARLLLAEMLAYEAIWGPDHNADLLVDARDIVRGLERDSPGTVGLVSLKAHLCDIGWNFAQAEPLHRRALAVSPDDAGSLCNYSLHLTAFGRHAEAVQTARRAVLANPVSANVALIQSRAEYAAGHCVEAMETGERVRLQVARDPIPLSFIEGQRDYITGNPQPDMLGVHEACDDSYAFKRAHIAYHHALRGDRERAFAAMGDSMSGSAIDRLAMIPTLLKLGDVDEAMRHAEYGAARQSAVLPVMLAKPEAAALAAHPRFGKLRRMIFASGLPDVGADAR